jgi:hypothetical protein
MAPAPRRPAAAAIELTSQYCSRPPGPGKGISGTVKNGSRDFKTLDWLGFCSTAKDKATFYLDNLDLSNK